MKKLFGKSFLALALAMTMLMGMSMTVMAKESTIYDTWQHYSGHGKNIWYKGKIDVYEYHDEGSEMLIMECDEDGCGKGNFQFYAYGQMGWTSEVTCPHITTTNPNSKSSYVHKHSYEWNTVVDPTTEQDGVEAYICSCGDIQATQPISAAHNILKVNADAVKIAKAGATVVVELGRLNSLPRWFVTKLVERDDLNVTLKITYNHENYTLEVPKTATIEDESIEWYGPLKLLSMFPQK